MSIEKPLGTIKSNWKPLTGSVFFKKIFKILLDALSIDWDCIVKKFSDITLPVTFISEIDSLPVWWNWIVPEKKPSSKGVKLKKMVLVSSPNNCEGKLIFVEKKLLSIWLT